MDDSPDDAVLLGRLAAALAAGVPPAQALALLVDALALRGAVLRRSADPRDVLAVAGDVLHAVPGGPARADAVLELAVPGGGLRELAVLAVEGARPSLLPVLRAAAAVLGLALSRAPSSVAAEIAAVLQEADEDAEALADALHDGPVQSLLVARYACDAVVRGADPQLARDAVQAAVVDLRRTLWHLRPRGSEDLPPALAALADLRAEVGAGALVLAVEPAAAARLTPAARATVFRLVQAVSGTGTVRVALRSAGPDVQLDVDGGIALDGPDRWRRRLRALGGDLASSAGRLRLTLPGGTDVPAQRPAPRPDQRPVPALLPVRPAVGAATPEEACS